jgi:diguanylate cyclase (GGDEF)-like protein
VAARILSYEWESISTRAELHRLAEAVRDREHTEAVTGLPNREALLEALEREWELSRRGSVETYVVVAHLHDHDAVAEQHGDALTNLILKDVAEVFSGAVRRADHLAQVATDALAIVLVGCKGDEGARAFVGRVERSLQRVAAARPAPARLAYGIEALGAAGSAAEAVDLAEVAARAAQPSSAESPEGVA